MPPFAALPPEADVYRAASNQTWVDFVSGKFSPDAFKLRRRDVEANSGVSVIVTGDCPSLEEAAKMSHRDRVRAVCRLNIGQVRALGAGLDVIQDAAHHGYVAGRPFTKDEADLAAVKLVNHFAEALAEASAICSPAE